MTSVGFLGGKLLSSVGFLEEVVGFLGGPSLQTIYSDFLRRTVLSLVAL
jgi:hypothetical protein